MFCVVTMVGQSKEKKNPPLFPLALRLYLDICALGPHRKLSSLLLLFYHSQHYERILGLIRGLLPDIVSEIHLPQSPGALFPVVEAGASDTKFISF